MESLGVYEGLTTSTNTGRGDQYETYFLVILEGPETMSCRQLYGQHHGRFWGKRPIVVAVLSTSPSDWKKSPGRCPSRALVINTTRLGVRIAQVAVDSEIPEFTDLDFDTHFNVRGITNHHQQQQIQLVPL